MDDATLRTAPPKVRLCVVEGPDANAVFDLDKVGEYRVGRKEECEILVSDMATSRVHALLRVGLGDVRIEDKSSENGIFVNNARVPASELRTGDRIRIGGNLFVLESDADSSEEPTRYTTPSRERQRAPSAARSGAAPSRSGARIWILVGALALASGFFTMAVLRDKTGTTEKQTAQPAPPAQTTEAPAPLQTHNAGLGKSEELFQQGMFFYRAGNLKRATDVWAEAMALEPTNANYKKWMQRVERELDQEIDKRYRQGLLAKKYMRRDEARHELQLVVEWTRNKQDERYLSALKLLDELGKE